MDRLRREIVSATRQVTPNVTRQCCFTGFINFSVLFGSLLRGQGTLAVTWLIANVEIVLSFSSACLVVPWCLKPVNPRLQPVLDRQVLGS